MLARETLNQFHVQLFHWVKGEWEAALASDYTELASIRSVEGGSFVEVLRSWPKPKTRLLAVALNKSRPVQSKATVGDLVGGISPEEGQLLGTFRQDAWRRSSQVRLTGAGGVWSASQQAKQSTLRQCVRKRLATGIGTFEDFDGANSWRYVRNLGAWVVRTNVEVAKNENQLSYHHTLVRVEGETLVESLSLLAWLGLMGSTRWNLIREGEEAAAAEILGSMIERFLGSAEGLLKGL